MAGATFRENWRDLGRAWSATGIGAFNNPREDMAAPAPAIAEGKQEVKVNIEVVKATRWQQSEEATRQKELSNHERSRDILLTEVVSRLLSLERGH